MAIAVKRQTGVVPSIPNVDGFTGTAAVATEPANTDSLIASPTDATGDDDNPAGTTLTIGPPVANPTSSDSSTSSSTPAVTGSSSSASKKGSSIPMGTVIGVCVGVFIALSAVLLLVLWYGQRSRRKHKRMYAKKNGSPRSPITDNRNDGRNMERRKSGREVWVKMEDNDDDVYEKYAMKRTSTATHARSDDERTAVVERSVTVKSAKSSKTFKSIGYGAGLGLAETFKTHEMPPRLEFTDSEMGTGRSVVPPFARSQEVDSWGGDTVGDNSFLSLKHGSTSTNMDGAMSPSMVMSYQTPPASTTELHHWHEAEIVSPDGDAYNGLERQQQQSRHPYAATRTSQENIRTQPAQKSKNPFLDPNPFTDSALTPPPPSGDSTASMYSMQSDQTLRVQGTQLQHARKESDPEREHRAMQSLIAALNISPDEAKERLSAATAPTPRQSALSTASSKFSESDALDESSFERFPLPPTDLRNHRS